MKTNRSGWGNNDCISNALVARVSAPGKRDG